MNYYPPWGMWGPQQQQPVVFMQPPPNNPPNTSQQPQSWQDVIKIAKREAKRENKLKEKWNKEQDEKKKKDGPKKPMIPVAEGLFLMVLLSPLVGLPTLYLYKTLFQMWGNALGFK